MFTDIIFIIITALALFGIYCIAETVSETVSGAKYPPSVTIVHNSQEDLTFRKIRYIQENVPNNHVIVYPLKNDVIMPQINGNLEEFIKDVLCVNNQ